VDSLAVAHKEKPDTHAHSDSNHRRPQPRAQFGARRSGRSRGCCSCHSRNLHM